MTRVAARKVIFRITCYALFRTNYGGYVSKEYRLYFNKKFSKRKCGYWISTSKPLIHAQRWVWINYNGNIPKGIDIHHIDGNKDNNEINNLQSLTRSEHQKKHWEQGDHQHEIEKRIYVLSIAREWLSTEEGRKKQSEDAIEGWKNRKKIRINCLQCQKEIETTQPWAKFCSDACDKKWRRKNGLYNVEAKCPMCDKVFLKDKFAKNVFCSISCGAKNSAKNRNKNK